MDNLYHLEMMLICILSHNRLFKTWVSIDMDFEIMLFLPQVIKLFPNSLTQISIFTSGFSYSLHQSPPPSYNSPSLRSTLSHLHPLPPAPPPPTPPTPVSHHCPPTSSTRSRKACKTTSRVTSLRTRWGYDPTDVRAQDTVGESHHGNPPSPPPNVDNSVGRAESAPSPPAGVLAGRPPRRSERTVTEPTSVSSPDAVRPASTGCGGASTQRASSPGPRCPTEADCAVRAVGRRRCVVRCVGGEARRWSGVGT